MLFCSVSLKKLFTSFFNDFVIFLQITSLYCVSGDKFTMTKQELTTARPHTKPLKTECAGKALKEGEREIEEKEKRERERKKIKQERG